MLPTKKVSVCISDINKPVPYSKNDMLNSNTYQNVNEIVHSVEKEIPKTLTERVRKYLAGKRLLNNEQSAKKDARTSTERSQMYRMRKRLENDVHTQLNLSQITASVETTWIENTIAPISSVQNNIKSVQSARVKKIPKTAAERSRAYRARKKRLAREFATQQMLYTPFISSRSVIVENTSQQSNININEDESENFVSVACIMEEYTEPKYASSACDISENNISCFDRQDVNISLNEDENENFVSIACIKEEYTEPKYASSACDISENNISRFVRQNKSTDYLNGINNKQRVVKRKMLEYENSNICLDIAEHIENKSLQTNDKLQVQQPTLLRSCKISEDKLFKELDIDPVIAKDNFFFFGLQVASQLRKLPPQKALKMQIDILKTLTEE